MKKYSKYLAGVLTLLLFLICIVQVNQIKKEPLVSNQGQSYVKATVLKVIRDNLQEDGNRYGSQTVTIRITQGSHKGEEYEAESPSGTLFGADCVPGLKVIAILNVSGKTVNATVYAQDRSVCILGFVLIFFLTIVWIGGKKGWKSIGSLIFTFVCIFGLLFPMVYRGYSPFGVTVLVAIATTVFTICFVGGWNHKSFAAMIGTISGVVLAGIVAQLFGKIAGINGYNVSDIESLNYMATYTKIRIGELLFAGIIISALGAVMDVGMSLASAMDELYQKKPDLSRKELFRAGMHIGQDMMGTMTNTLILAYVGGSLTTLLLNYAYDLPANQLINSYQIGIEIMQGLSGSMGVVLTVPITAVVAALLITRKEERKK